MKKKLLSLMLIMTMTLSLIACGGKNDDSSTATTNNNTATEEGPIMEIVEEEIVRGEEQEEDTGYKRSPKWDDISAPYMAVQIQDYFFETGMTVQELYDMLEESGKDFVWDKTSDEQIYTPDDIKKVAYGYTLRIDFGPEINVGVYNPNGTETPLKDCICTWFGTTSILSSDAYVFGYNGSEILYKWTADDVKTMMQSGGMFEGFEITNDSSAFLDIENSNVNHEILKNCKISFQLYENQVEHITFQISSK